MAIRFLLIIGGLLGVCQGMSAAVYNGNCGANGNNVTWSLNTSTGVMTLSGSGAMADWDNTTTPWNSYLSSIQTVKVGSGITRIGNEAFYNCKNLSSVTFTGTTVTTIGQFSFFGCSNLTSITFPNSLTSIEWDAFEGSGFIVVNLPSSFTSLGSGAFFGSTNLKYVIIPSSVTTIKNQAFQSCSSLEEIHVKWTTSSAIPAWPTSFTNKTPSSIKLYVPCGTKSLYQAKDGWKNYTIVEETASGVCGSHLIWSLSCDGVLTIRGIGAMMDWASETNVPWYSYRSSITSVSIANGVTSIGSYAFYGCSNLTSCPIPSSITQIGGNAFRGCSKLTAITIPNSVTSLGAYAFYGCSKLKEVTLSENLTEIKSCTFQNCSSLVSITIPNGVINVGWASFYGCAALTNIYVSWTENIPSWGPPTNKSPQSSITLHVPCGTKSLYQAKDGWKNYTLTETTIGGNCGASGNNLTWSFCIGTGTLTISGSGAMADWGAETDVPWYNYRTNITSVVLPVGLTHIGAYAFYATGITKIDIPAAVQSFGQFAFVYSGLQEICIPEGVTTLPDNLFHHAVSVIIVTPLKRIYLPSTLTTIGNRAIGRHYLSTLTYPASITTLGSSVYVYSTSPVQNDVYASWPIGQIPQKPGVNFSNPTPKPNMHVPYGTKSAYGSKGWSQSYTIVEDVDERAIDLGLSVRWASCNVGATAPEEFGTYFSWGDTTGGYTNYNWAEYPYSIGNTNTVTKYTPSGTYRDDRTTLIAFDDAAYINWGETWRMPTKEEWQELIDNCTFKYETVNNVACVRVTGPNGNSILLPRAGHKWNGATYSDGAGYWTASLYSDSYDAHCFYNKGMNGMKRCAGMPVRAVYRREWPSFTLTICDTTDGSTYTKTLNAAATYTLTAKEDDCYTFVRWSDGNTDKTRTVTVTADARYTAEFEEKQYTITVTTDDASMGSVSIIDD